MVQNNKNSAKISRVERTRKSVAINFESTPWSTSANLANVIQLTRSTNALFWVIAAWFRQCGFFALLGKWRQIVFQF